MSAYKCASVIKKGLWSCYQELNFSDDKSNASCPSIKENGNIIIQTASLDKELWEEHVTFIKMDIEGAELEALKGAENIIRRDRPKLAICVYHKGEDIVSIPEYLLTVNPSYRFYLRQYGYMPLETVLYAV